jgi:hypothetical protein
VEADFPCRRSLAARLRVFSLGIFHVRMAAVNRS